MNKRQVERIRLGRECVGEVDKIVSLPAHPHCAGANISTKTAEQLSGHRRNLPTDAVATPETIVTILRNTFAKG